MNASRIIGPNNSDDLHYAYEVHTYAHTALMIMVRELRASHTTPGRRRSPDGSRDGHYISLSLSIFNTEDGRCASTNFVLDLDPCLKDEYFNVAWTEDDQQQGLAVMEKLVRVSFCEKFALDLESHHDF